MVLGEGADTVEKLQEENKELKNKLKEWQYIWIYPLGMVLGFLIMDNGLYDFIEKSRVKWNRVNLYDNFIFQKYCENFYWQRDEKGNFIVYLELDPRLNTHFCHKVPPSK